MKIKYELLKVYKQSKPSNTMPFVAPMLWFKLTVPNFKLSRHNAEETTVVVTPPQHLKKFAAFR